MSGHDGGPPGTGAREALASPPRRRLLDLLRTGGTPRDAQELAAATGLHVSTVRFHLDVLRRAGLVMARSERRATPGRPRSVYAAVSTSETGGYPALTRLLAAHLAETPEAGAARAEQAGVAWATELIPEADRLAGVDAEQAARVVTGMFAELDFDPELAGDATDRQIRLRACPFRTAARANPGVVCSVHLGLLRGTLARLGAPPTTVRLLPFVEPELCLAQLTPAG
ncbi:MAG TPA: helix-turn-helix domain-containing protein [Mycobacteriales bacterium]|nr:helix-turn-helix domain-containing protein [Mycobacteriales bacterium]